MESGNSKTVFVVQIDHNKDLSDAKKYGELRAVFSNPKKPYNTDALLSMGRKVLADYRFGDYILMLGDPALCAVCVTLAAEVHGSVNILSWDRNTFKYAEQTWYFQDFNSAD